MARRTLLLVLLLALAGADRPPQAGVEHVSAGRAGLALVEPHVAVNPADPRRAVVAAMQVASADHTDWRVVAFRRDPARGVWLPVDLPAYQGRICRGDPWTGWAAGDTVQLVCLADLPRPDGRDWDFGVLLHTSPDAGASWLPPVRVPTADTGSWDHPVLLVQPGGAGRPTRLAVAGTWNGRRFDGPAVVRSDDGGRSFLPLAVYQPPERTNDTFGGAAWDPSGGVRFTYLTMREDGPRPYYLVTPAGAAFERHQLREHITPWGFPSVAGAATPAGPVLTAWLEGTRAQGTRVFVGDLRDPGAPPVVLTPEPDAFRARPQVVVADSGRVAVTWFEQPLGAADQCGFVILRASRDAGRTFPHDVTVNEGQACTPGERGLHENRWTGGGDYSGVAVAGRRVFVVWSAGPVGRPQVWGRWVDLP